MTDISAALRALSERLLEGGGHTSSAQRRAAFDGTGEPEHARALVSKISLHAHRVTDEDVQRALAAGLLEDQVFELAVCAAVGQASRQYDAARAALARACGEE